jgi:hypothetical protein
LEQVRKLYFLIFKAKIKICSCSLSRLNGFSRLLIENYLADNHLANSHLADSHLADSHLADSRLPDSHLPDSHLADSILAYIHLADSRLTDIHLATYTKFACHSYDPVIWSKDIAPTQCVAEKALAMINTLADCLKTFFYYSVNQVSIVQMDFGQNAWSR